MFLGELTLERWPVGRSTDDGEKVGVKNLYAQDHRECVRFGWCLQDCGGHEHSPIHGDWVLLPVESLYHYTIFILILCTMPNESSMRNRRTGVVGARLTTAVSSAEA